MPATCRLMASREALAGSQRILGGLHLEAWLCAVSRCRWMETELHGWLSHASPTLSGHQPGPGAPTAYGLYPLPVSAGSSLHPWSLAAGFPEQPVHGDLERRETLCEKQGRANQVSSSLSQQDRTLGKLRIEWERKNGPL